MRQDKLSQRLKLRRDSFDFAALIEGVSTLVENEPAERCETGLFTGLASVKEVAPASAREHRDDASTAPATRNRLEEAPARDRLEIAPAARDYRAEPPIALRRTEPPAAAPLPHVDVPIESGVVPFALAPERPDPAAEQPVAMHEPQCPVEPPMDLPSQERAAASTSAPQAPEAATTSPGAPKLPGTQTPVYTLGSALDTLSSRLVQEVGAMAEALADHAADEAGYRLAHVNQILEILTTLDPGGELSRLHGVKHAPPSGRTWPSTCWSAVELAESPVSALIPPDVDATFVPRLLYSAWGVSLEDLTATVAA